MKSSLIRTSCVIAFCLLSLKVVAGCAVITIETLTKFDSSEYIFIGEVIGMSDPITSEKFHGKAWGVKIRVKEYVNLPKTPAGHFVVLPFTLESDCKDGGRSAEELHRYFPVGSEVRVIAKESRYAKGLIGEGNIGLEVRPHNLGSISRNYSGTDKAASVGGGAYDLGGAGNGFGGGGYDFGGGYGFGGGGYGYGGGGYDFGGGNYDYGGGGYGYGGEGNY